MLPRPSPECALLLLALTLASATPVGALSESLGSMRVIGYDAQPTDNVASYTAMGLGDAAGLDGHNVTIAVVSTGVENDHPTFRGAFRNGHDFVVEPHVGECNDPDDADGMGTFAASVALGRGGGRVTRGVAPGAGLVDVRVAAAATSVTPALIATGIDWVIDLNAGRAGGGCALDVPVRLILVPHAFPASPDGSDEATAAVARATEAGILVVVPAGDTGPDPSTVQSPGVAPSALTVGAMEHRGTANRNQDHIQATSARGGPGLRKPDLLAPGGNVTAAKPHTVPTEPHQNRTDWGTHVAASHAAGAAALLLQAQRLRHGTDLTPSEAKGLLMATADDVGPSGWDTASGAGYVDAFRAVVKILNRPPQVVVTAYPADPQVSERVRVDAGASGDLDPFDGIALYTFEWGDGRPATKTTAPVADHVYTKTGAFTVRVTAVDRWGVSATTETPITVVPFRETDKGSAPLSLFTYTPLQPVEGTQVRFDASGSVDDDDDIVRYEWDFDFDVRGAFDVEATGETATHAFDRPGNTTVALRVWDRANHRALATASVTVFAAPPPPVPPPVVRITHPRFGDTVAAGEIAVYWAVVVGESQRFVVELDGRGVAVVAGPPTYLRLTPGNHTITVVAFDPAGRESADSARVRAVEAQDLSPRAPREGEDDPRNLTLNSTRQNVTKKESPGPALAVTLGAAAALAVAARRATRRP